MCETLGLPCATGGALRRVAGGVRDAPTHLSDTATGAGAPQDTGDLSELDRAVLHGGLAYVVECLRCKAAARAR